MMSPGTYLRKRRAQRALTLHETAIALAALPEAVGSTSTADILRLEARLTEVEADIGYLQPEHAALLARVIPLDPAVYEQLFTLHHAGQGAADQWGLPVPQICRSCACTWHDACHTTSGTCSWSRTDPELCSACDSHVPASFAAPRAPYRSVFGSTRP